MRETPDEGHFPAIREIKFKIKFQRAWLEVVVEEMDQQELPALQEIAVPVAEG